eukprot:m51a1_g105 hypothetical protein (117) ;mRNA; r:324507-325238
MLKELIKNTENGSPSRRFIKEGTVLQLDPQEKHEHELHVYLFNDVILLSKANVNSRGQRKVVELLKLSGAKSATYRLPSDLQTWSFAKAKVSTDDTTKPSSKDPARVDEAPRALDR